MGVPLFRLDQTRELRKPKRKFKKNKNVIAKVKKDKVLVEITDELIDSYMTPRGGFTKQTIRMLTGEHKSPTGWKDRCIGKFLTEGQIKSIQKSINKCNVRENRKSKNKSKRTFPQEGATK
jgi:hypothetical protein